VFNPFRPRAVTSPYTGAHFTELPVLVILWGLVTAAVVWRGGWNGQLRRLFVLLSLLTAVLIVLLTDDAVWHHLPASVTHIQFTFRLETYVVMAIAALVIVLLRALQDDRLHLLRSRAIIATLWAIVFFGVALGCWQVWNSNAGFYPGSRGFLKDRSAVLGYPNITPPTWYTFGLAGSFRDATAPVVPTDGAIYLGPA
jgi:hypothetical protein